MRELADDLPLLLAASSAAITGRTRLIRRSALVNVPSFSRNDVPGRNTWANAAVSLRNRSWTTSSSSAASARLHVLGVGVGLRDVLALDVQRPEGAVDRRVEHVGDAQARARRSSVRAPQAFSNMARTASSETWR